MTLFSRKNLKREYSDPLYIYFKVLGDKWTDAFNIDNPVNREYIEGVIDIIQSFDRGQGVFQWYQWPSEVYFLERKLMDYRVRIDAHIYKNKSYYDFWTSVHKTLLSTYISNKKNHLDDILVV